MCEQVQKREKCNVHAVSLMNYYGDHKYVVIVWFVLSNHPQMSVDYQSFFFRKSISKNMSLHYPY